MTTEDNEASEINRVLAIANRKLIKLIDAQNEEVSQFVKEYYDLDKTIMVKKPKLFNLEKEK